MEISKKLEELKEVREEASSLAIKYNNAKQRAKSIEESLIEQYRSRIYDKFSAKTGRWGGPTHIELKKVTDRGIVFTTSYLVGGYGEYDRIYVKIELTYDVIKMSDEDFNTYIESYRETMQELKEKRNSGLRKLCGKLERPGEKPNMKN